MSKNYVKAVLDHLPSLRSPTEKLVLLAIAEYTSDETRLAWPSVRSLVRRTCLSERAVQYAIRRLEKSGLMSITIGGQLDSINTASCYRLDFDHRGERLEAKAPPKRALQRVVAKPTSTPQSQNATPRLEPEKLVSREEASNALDAIYNKLGRRRKATPP